MASFDEYERIMASNRWRRCRDAYIKRVRGLCEDCLKQGIYTPGAQVHHKQRITPDNVNEPSIVYGTDNLVLLCKECHDKRHGKLKPKADFVTGHVEL